MILKKIKKPTLPKKWVGIVFGIIFGFIGVLYALFLIIPRTIDVSKYTPQINELLKDYTKLELVLVEPKISTTFDLGLKISAGEIALKYEDASDFLKLEKPSIKINLLTLLVKNLNLDKIYVQNAELNLVFDKNKKYTIEDYIIFPEEKETQDIVELDEDGKYIKQNTELPVNIKNINIIADNINVTLDDKNVSKKFILNGKNNNIHLSSLNGPIKIKTEGYLGSDKTHFVDFKIDLSSPLPKVQENVSDKEQEEFKFPDYNPLSDIDKFKFYAKTDVDLKISSLDEFKGKGHIYLSDISMTIKDVELPKSYINVDVNGNAITNDAKLYVAKDEYFVSNGTTNLGKKSTFDINAKTEKISLNNIRILLSSVLDMLSIKNDLKNTSATGHLTCDFNIKNDGNNIKSKGKSEIINGSFKYPAINVNLTEITSILDFSNDKLSIKETSAKLNGSKFGMTGEILTNSNLNIDINSDPIKIADIIALGTSLKVLNPKDISDFDFKTGIIKIAIKLKGTLSNIIPDANVVVDNTSLVMKSLKMPINISNIKIYAKPKGTNDFEGTIDVNNLSAYYPDLKMNVKAQNIIMPIDSKNIEIKKSDLTSDGSVVALSGNIKNYQTKPEFTIDLDGKIAPNTVLNMIPKQNRKLVKYQGQMPVKTVISGDLDNIKVKGEVTSNPQNYISVIDIDSIKGVQNTLNYDLDVKGDVLNLSDISINSSRGGKIASVKGKLSSIYKANPVIKNLSISIPQKTSVTISPLDNTKLSLVSNMNVAGTVNNPIITGSADITNFVYPPFNLKAADTKINFKKSVISAVSSGISVANSDFAGNAEISTNMSKGIVMNELNFKSNNFDSDALMKLVEKMPQSSTAPGSDAGDIQINKGHGEISRLKSGGLSINNVEFDYNLKRNLFDIKNLKAVVYGGNVEGEASYHLSQLRTTANVTATNVNAGQFSSAFTGLIVPVTGAASGMAKISFKGSTMYQQMQTLTGNAKFSVKNGEIKDFIKLENLLRAGNVLSQNIIGFNLNSVLSTVSKKNTGSFETLEGSLSFGNGIANIQTFKTRGNQMSVSVTGKYNMLTNYADMRVLGRISSTLVSVMGPLGNYSVGSLVENAASKNDTVNNILNVVKSIAPANPLFQIASTEELNQIPTLTTNAENKMFMAVIQGLANKTTAVKTFKWIDSKQQTQAE